MIAVAFDAKITVIGVGGAGCNTVTRLTDLGISSAETIAVNSDKKHLDVVTRAHKKLLLGKDLLRGLGCGGYPEKGKQAAEYDKPKIVELLSGTELLFLTTGMGGGTGTGAAPVIAKIAKELGITVVSFTTFPFALEGKKRIEKAKAGGRELLKYSDAMIIIDNNKLLKFAGNLPMDQAFALADEIVAKAIKGISDTIQKHSLVNIDFADMRMVMKNGGISTISIGEASGHGRVAKAVEGALNNPLLDVDLREGKTALIHISGGNSLTIKEAVEAGESVVKYLRDDAEVIWGARVEPELADSLMVTAIVTGLSTRLLDDDYKPQRAFTVSSSISKAAATPSNRSPNLNLSSSDSKTSNDGLEIDFI